MLALARTRRLPPAAALAGLLVLTAHACTGPSAVQGHPASVAQQASPTSSRAPATATVEPLGPPAPSPPSAGVIQCGAKPCDAKSGACVRLAGKPPMCVPKSDRDAYARGGNDSDSVLDCDDDPDCPAGEHCCAGQYWGGTGPHIHMCTKERCADAIACVPATGCPGELTCTAEGEGDQHCSPAASSAQCGAVRCSGATPVCCWNMATGRGACIAEPRNTAHCSGEDEWRIRCRNRRDCGGYDCCQQMANSTDCWSSCPGPALGVACETFADCPEEGPGPGGIRQRYDRCENGSCNGKLCYAPDGYVPCDSL